eukprot:COSAG05_NODE_11619_length_504_cov_210.676543_1_plen_74_part_00
MLQYGYLTLFAVAFPLVRPLIPRSVFASSVRALASARAVALLCVALGLSRYPVLWVLLLRVRVHIIGHARNNM